MTEEIKRINIKEFRELGYLQELNRRFLHPLGLALEILVDKDGNEKLNGIWDYRDDPEGLNFGLADSTAERKREFYQRYQNIEGQLSSRISTRYRSLGYYIEPIERVEIENYKK